MFRHLILLPMITLAAVPIANAQERPPPPPIAPPSANARPQLAPPGPGSGTSGQGRQSAWVRLCETAGARGVDAFGKELQVGRRVCITHHERIDGNNGTVLVAVGVRDTEGQPRHQFTILSPPGAQRQAGLRAAFYPHALWQKVSSNQRLDPREESTLKRLTLGFAFCHANGCTAEMDATQEVINDLTSYGGIVVFAAGPAGQPIAIPVPLTGFREAHFGVPTDSVAYHKARSELMQKIRARQQPGPPGQGPERRSR